MFKHTFLVVSCCLCIVSCKKAEPKADSTIDMHQDSITTHMEPEAKTTTTGFGLYDHSLEDAYKTLEVSHLLGVSYLSYELDPNTGNAISTHDWATTALIDSLHAHGVKCYLSITNEGEANNSKFLRNNKSIDHLIESATKLLQLRKADGIHIRFENVSPRDGDNLTRFITKFKYELKKYNKHQQLAITIPNEASRVYDINALNTVVDWFILESPEPMSESVSEYYLEMGVPQQKLKVGLRL